MKDAKRKSSKSAAAKDSNATTPRGNRRHSEPSRRKSSKSASQAKKTRSKRSKSQGDTHTRKERTGEDGEELSDWSDESSCEEDEDGSQGETYSDSWEGNSQEESEDINTATGYTGPDAAAEDAGASQNDGMPSFFRIPYWLWLRNHTVARALKKIPTRPDSSNTNVQYLEPVRYLIRILHLFYMAD